MNSLCVESSDRAIEVRFPAAIPMDRDAFYEFCQSNKEEYLANGARLGFLIDPKDKRVYRYRLDGEPEILEHPSSLSGDPELRCLRIELDAVW